MRKALELLAKETDLDTDTLNRIAHILEIAFSEGELKGVADCTAIVNEHFGLGK